MQLFIVFILGAVVLGAGSMLSPAWRTAQPRIALSASLCLALVVGGAVFYAEAFGWDTLVVDYLLFALMSGVVLGGTLSHAQARAEAKGETLPDEEQGWPGPYDLVFFAVAAFVILIPLMNLPLPLGDHGAQLGYQTLIIRYGESFTSLAPFHPEITVIYSPGFHAFSAYLSQQLGQPIPMIQMAITAVVLYLCVWLAYDFGAEFHDKRLGRAMSIAMFLCGGVFISYVDGHYTELMGLLFMMSFLMYALRFVRHFNLADMVAGGLMMGAVVYSNLTMSLILILGFIPLTVLAWFYRDTSGEPATLKSRIGLLVGFPLVAIIGIAPWLFKNIGLMFPITPSPYVPDLNLLSTLIFEQGGLIVLLAILGAGLGLTVYRANRWITILMLIWLLLLADFAFLGIIGRIIPPLGDLSNAPSIARHGLIFPFVWLGGQCLLWLWDTRLSLTFQTGIRRVAYPLMIGVAVLGILGALAFQSLLKGAQGVLHLPDASIMQDDIDAMLWIKANSADDAMVSAVGDEGDWLAVFAERNALNFSAVRYFEWDAVEMPDVDPFAVDYVFVPAGVDSEPAGLASQSPVYSVGSARVYEIYR